MRFSFFSWHLAAAILAIATSQQAQAAGNAAAIRYELAKNRLFLLQGRLQDAEAALHAARQLGAENDREYLVARLNTCLRVVCGKEGWETMRTLQARYPKDEAIRKLAETWKNSSGSTIASRVSIAETGDKRSDKVLRLQSELRLADRWRLGAITDLNRTTLKDLRDPVTGQVRTFKRTAVNAEVYNEFIVSRRTTARAQVFFNKEKVGLGAVLTRRDYSGALQLVTAWQQPYWDYNELLARDGTRDRVLLTRQQRINDQWSVELGGGAAQYNVDDFKAADSWLLQGAVVWRLPEKNALHRLLGTGSYSSLRYGLDAEYKGNTETRTATDGSTFTPVPLESREFHSITATVGKSWSSGWLAEGYGGYSIDRFGSSAPLMGATVGYNARNGITIAGEATQSLNTGNQGSDTYTYTGLRLNWLY